MLRDLPADMPSADPFRFVEFSPDGPFVLGRADTIEAGNGSHVVDGREFLERLRNTHEDTLAAIARAAHVVVVHSSDPGEHEGIVTPAQRTRPYKSYEQTATHIAGILGDIGLRHAAVASDISLLHTIANPAISNPHLVWLNTAGVQGRDPMAQTPGLLEAAGIPYVGHRPAAYAASDDKVTAEGVLRARGVPVPRSVDLTHLGKAGIAGFSERLIQAADSERYVVAKPINGRGSVGVARIDLQRYTASTLAEELGEQSGKYIGIKVDEFLPGSEVTVSVLGTADRTIIFPPLLRTVDPATGIFESLDSQAVAGRAAALNSQDPALPQIARTTRDTYEALGLEGLARIDLRASAKGVFTVIDVNPKPDLGTSDKQSLTEIAAEHAGVSLNGLIELVLLSRIDQGFAAHPNFQELLSGR